MTSFNGVSNINGDYDSSEDGQDIENSSKWGSSMAPINSLSAIGLKKKTM